MLTLPDGNEMTWPRNLSRRLVEVLSLLLLPNLL